MQSGTRNALLQGWLFFQLGVLSLPAVEPQAGRKTDPEQTQDGDPVTQNPAVQSSESDDISMTLEDARERVRKSTLKMGLSLDHVTMIDSRVAAELSRTQGLLSLNGLRTIDPESAQALTSHGGLSVELNGLEEISPQVAAALARASYLKLNALKPGPEVIRELGSRSGSLQLNALKSLDVESATHLTRQRFPLSLNGVKSISTDVAKVLADSQASISMEGLEELSADAQDEFSKHTGGWTLRSLRSLHNTKLAQNLAGQRLGVLLPKLEDISTDCLAILATSQTSVSLGLQQLSVEQTRALSKCQSRLSLPRVRRLNKEQIEILLQCPARLELQGLSELLDARLAERLTKDASQMLRVDQVESLSGEAAAAITTGRHILTLYNLRSLDPAVAKALASHRGRLILSGLQEMSDEHAELFAARNGLLYLSRDMVLSDRARQLLESNKQIKWKKQ